MSRISEYEVENLFIDRLEGIGYKYIDLSNYDDILANFRKQLAAFNSEALVEAKGEAWGITHDREATYKPIITIRRFL